MESTSQVTSLATGNYGLSIQRQEEELAVSFPLVGRKISLHFM